MGDGIALCSALFVSDISGFDTECNTSRGWNLHCGSGTAAVLSSGVLSSRSSVTWHKWGWHFILCDLHVQLHACMGLPPGMWQCWGLRGLT